MSRSFSLDEWLGEVLAGQPELVDPVLVCVFDVVAGVEVEFRPEPGHVPVEPIGPTGEESKRRGIRVGEAERVARLGSLAPVEDDAGDPGGVGHEVGDRRSGVTPDPLDLLPAAALRVARSARLAWSGP